MKLTGLAAAAAALMLSAAPANAALYQFTISGDYSASFQIDSSPALYDSYPGSGFSVINVAGVYGGAAKSVGIQFFLSPPPFGIDDPVAGLIIVDLDSFDWLLDGIGAQLFTGTEYAPTFRLGSFPLISGGTLRENYTLTIAETPAVPEPAAWGLMLGGFAMAGGALRRRAARIALA